VDSIDLQVGWCESEEEKTGTKTVCHWQDDSASDEDATWESQGSQGARDRAMVEYREHRKMDRCKVGNDVEISTVQPYSVYEQRDQKAN
jgi:hypothetical protein